MKVYVVYILTNKINGTLYVGVTNDLKRRIVEHREGACDGFTKKYDLKKLVYIEQFACVYSAIAREKRLKHWNRKWKIDLIEKQNSGWIDLYESIFGPEKK
jgi:putative endonuclease